MGPTELNEARQEEFVYIDKIGMREEIPVNNWWGETRKPLTGAMLADVIRSSLVARDLREKRGQTEDLFAAIPPVYALN